MANFEAFRWIMSSSINLLFLKSDNIVISLVKLLKKTKKTMACKKLNNNRGHITLYLSVIMTTRWLCVMFGKTS